MRFRPIRSKEEVCRERASTAAKEKYDELISEKRKEYYATRNIKIMQQIIKLSKEKNKYKDTAYKHFFDNYVEAADSVDTTLPEDERKKFGLKEFSDYMIKHLSEI